MPAVRKVLPLTDSAYLEVVVFGDVEAKDRFIVQTWHRTARVENGKVTKVVYGYSYPGFPSRREDPPPEAFYNGDEAKLVGKRNDTVLISTSLQKQFDITAQYDGS